uniref:Uncharacterized protein LOC101511517 n=1 Tax=Cicer arietinum TaxID=3827 RepID=A0A1S2XP24_CICAR|nr:uncharacterized protein LOC101511517 [Cicer arietinum]
MYGVVSSKKVLPQDDTIHVINSDDSETTLSTEPSQQPPPAKSTSKTPTPKKAKPSSPKPPSSSTKISEITSLFDLAELETIHLKMAKQYPRLLRDFYATSKGSKGTINFSMVLKGVHMEISPTTLCQILDIRDEGAYCLSETWYSQCVITRTSVLQNTLIKPPKPLVASNLVPLCRMLHNICVHSITPWDGSFEKVTELDLMIIHHLITGTLLHLGHVIFTFMLNAVVMGRSAPYGMILTKIFKFFKIPLKDEHSIHFNNTFSMKNIKQTKIQNDDRPASKKRKARSSSSLSQKSEAETTQPPPEDTPSPLIPEPTSPLRNSLDAAPSPDSPVHTPTQSSPIHKLTLLHEADPLPDDAFTSSPLQNMEDGEKLYFDLNLSYPSSPTDVPMAFPPTVPVDEDVFPPPDFSQPILHAANFAKPAQPLPEVTGVFSSLDSFFTTTTHNRSKDKAGSYQNKSSNVNDQPKIPSKRTEKRQNQKQMKLLKLIRKDQKKILHRFTHFQNSLVQFGLILEWVTKHLVPTIAPGDHPPELPAQPSFADPSPSSSSNEPSSSD